MVLNKTRLYRTEGIRASRLHCSVYFKLNYVPVGEAFQTVKKKKKKKKKTMWTYLAGWNDTKRQLPILFCE